MKFNFGINISGYINGEFGIGEGVRANIRAIEAAGIPFVINNFTKSPHRKQDASYQNFTQENPYPVNLIQVNADEVNNFIKFAGSSYLKNRYNIGFWAWELPTFPPQLSSVFTLFNEIWTYSNHCAESISMVSPIPVIKIMPSLSIITPEIDRERLGFPQQKFIFLFMFDFFSRMERKNPLAAIAAFKKAFGESNERVLLIVKSSNSQHFPEHRELLNSAIANCPSIQHIDGYLSKNEVNSLVYNCDCYVSLHRCEGFGLTMAEAMFFGKPTIATSYSSNTEFMNVGNSFLVRYDLKEIMADIGPYKKGNFWAEPDIEHAAYLMQYVFNNYQQAKQIGARGAEEIKSLLSPQVMGNKIRNRLEYISKITNNFTTLSSSNTEQIQPQQGNLERQLLPSLNLGEITSENSQPLVSICIPTYNGEDFIAEALESAFAQTYTKIEVIVSDDGSSDKTVAIAQSFQTKTSVDFRIVLHRNYGLAQNWNFCISQAKGEYIKFLFQDDLLEPDCIEKMVALAKQDTEIGLIFSPRGITIGESAKSNPLFLAASQSIKDLHKSWFSLKPIQRGIELLSDPNWMQNPINKIGEPSTVMIAADVFRKLGLFDPDLSQYLDLDMWFRIMGNYKIGFLNEKLSSLRIHAGQQTWKNFAAGENNKDVRRLYEKMLHSDIYSFLNQELREKVRQRLAGKPQSLLGELSKLIEQYRKSPTNQSNLTRLRQIRQQIAQKWLTLPADRLESAYLGEMGKAHKLLIESGIKNDILHEEERRFAEEIVANLAQTSERGITINYYLAGMLYREAYQLPLEYKNAAIPKWFFKDFIGFLFQVPSYFQEKGNLDSFCDYLQELIDYIHNNIFSYPDSEIWRYLAAFFSQNASLLPLYCNDVNLLNICTQRADIIEFTLKNIECHIDWKFEPVTTEREKIRLGILLEEIGLQKENFAAIAACEYLDKTKFEIILYNLQMDGKSAECGNNLTSKVVQLPEALPERVETIRADDLDILLIRTNWADPPQSTALLSLHRLARLQVAAMPTAATTGIGNIDYFIAGKLTLPATEAQAQYREKLITVDGSGLCFSYAVAVEHPTVHPTRISWGASEKTVIFMSGARAFKIIPELRETWAKIIAAVPNSILVLHPFRLEGENYPMMPFFNQMQAIFSKKGIDKKRIVAIKALPTRADFRECLKLADVYLDSFPWAGAASMVEPLLVGVPTVVREGESARSRQSGAMLREIQLPELVVDTEKSYIELSVALGTNPELRDRYRQQIQLKMAENPRFLDSYAYWTQMGALFEKLWRQHWREPLTGQSVTH
ncbi:MAG TPA: glycosyltransferase [Kamptonema sp.]|nr:glycosyltransferase [Kamptonema sp.]